MRKLNVFISYSHEDESYKEKLDKHLISLKRSEAIATWNDRKITPGKEWDKEIKNELELADIILLLVSVDFLNSNYSNEVELKRAIEKHDSGEAVVIPIILRQCGWQSASFSKIQALPKNAKPVKSFLDEDEAYFNIYEGVKTSVLDLQARLESQEEAKKKIEQERANGTISVIHSFTNECDTPPNNLYWSGREKEITEIKSNLHKVVFISGIGGQGKSGLASNYVKNIVPSDTTWEYWDWRDCKEKENRIHTKLISAIERVSKGEIKAKQLANSSTEDVIELLFNTINQRKIVFVFDNVDYYIDTESFQLIGTVGKLYYEALNREHGSKFIFTCRSTINDVHPELLNIKLHGISREETLNLFKLYALSISTEQLFSISNKSFELTNGHPLWLNLIAAQARRGADVVDKFINGIKGNSRFQEESFTSILTDKILGAIWDSLSDKQKTLLQALAEIVRAETQDTLSRILGSEITGNHFFKAFRTLKQLNLIVTKSSPNEADTYELHPLVKEYVMQNFAVRERSKFISLFVNFYDSIILILKPKISSEQTLSFFENWTAKIELLINKDDYKSALASLAEISSQISNSGYSEEYIRVSNLLFINIDWQNAINEEFSYFHDQLIRFIHELTFFGKFSEAKAFITKYQKNITNKSKNYIDLCDEQSHFYWFQGDFNKAIEYAKEAIALGEQSEINNLKDLRRTLALALRDTKQAESIQAGLDIFLDGKGLRALINDEIPDVQPEIYGNVGRCLQFLGKNEDALKCYKNSLRIIENGVNKGYGLMWVAECLLARGDAENALAFYRNAYLIWKPRAPVRAEDVNKKISAIVELHPAIVTMVDASEQRIIQLCSEWIIA